MDKKNKTEMIHIAGVIPLSENTWRAQIYVNLYAYEEKTFQEKELAILQRLIWELMYFKDDAPQLFFIKQKYPYLLNYLKVKTNMQFSSDIHQVREIGNQLLEDPHCPCMLVKNENTLCPCLPCRNKNHCHCGMFTPIQ